MFLYYYLKDILSRILYIFTICKYSESKIIVSTNKIFKDSIKLLYYTNIYGQ